MLAALGIKGHDERALDGVVMIVKGDHAGERIVAGILDGFGNVGLLGTGFEDGIAQHQRGFVAGRSEGDGRLNAVLILESRDEVLDGFAFSIEGEVIRIDHVGQQRGIADESNDIAGAVNAQELDVVQTGRDGLGQDLRGFGAVEGNKQRFGRSGGDLGQLRAEIGIGEAGAFLGDDLDAVFLALGFERLATPME